MFTISQSIDTFVNNGISYHVPGISSSAGNKDSGISGSGNSLKNAFITLLTALIHILRFTRSIDGSRKYIRERLNKSCMYYTITTHVHVVISYMEFDVHVFY